MTELAVSSELLEAAGEQIELASSMPSRWCSVVSSTS